MALWKHVPWAERGRQEERGRLHKLNSLLSVQEDGVLFFIIPMTSLLFACFMFPGIFL